MTTIKYYRTNQYGTEREFVHPDNADEADILRRLTGKTSIDSATRELVRDLSRGAVSFEETVAPHRGVKNKG